MVRQQEEAERKRREQQLQEEADLARMVQTMLGPGGGQGGEGQITIKKVVNGAEVTITRKSGPAQDPAIRQQQERVRNLPNEEW